MEHHDGISQEVVVKYSQDSSFNPESCSYGCGCRGQGCGCNTDYGCCGNIVYGC